MLTRSRPILHTCFTWCWQQCKRQGLERGIFLIFTLVTDVILARCNPSVIRLRTCTFLWSAVIHCMLFAINFILQVNSVTSNTRFQQLQCCSSASYTSASFFFGSCRIKISQNEKKKKSNRQEGHRRKKTTGETRSFFRNCELRTNGNVWKVARRSLKSSEMQRLVDWFINCIWCNENQNHHEVFFSTGATTHFGFVFCRPLAGYSLLAYEVSWSHTTTRHSR